MDEVSLQEMLTARERRFMLQTQLLQQYKKPDQFHTEYTGADQDPFRGTEGL